MLPIADLHCDLLGYLAMKPDYTPYDPEVLCSLPQLKEGGVKLQVLAFYMTTGKKMHSSFQKQVEWFERLLNEKDVLPYNDEWTGQKELSILPAIENASGLCMEEEELDLTFSRFEEFCQRVGPPLYISLTWNDENRFGGGNLSKVGLKRDGEILLDFLDERGVALDFSHTSDRLAEDLLNYIHKKGLKITPLASHSNFRAVIDQPRNLPDAIAVEIVKQGGVIGLNLVHDFIGPNYPEDLLNQVNHARSLGLLDALCFGTDFFYPNYLGARDRIMFHKELGSSACFPRLLSVLDAVLSEAEKEKVAYKNFLAYLGREEKIQLT